MNSNEMEEGKKPTNEKNGNLIEKKAPISLLKFNNANRSSIPKSFMSDPISNLNASTIFQNQMESVHTLQSIRLPITKSQPNINNPNPMTYKISSSGSAILNSVPTPRIPIQFQLAAAKTQHVEPKKSVGLKMNNIASILTSTPSGTNSTTVNHANRSLVYREPVSTKDTAPTKNIIGINTIRADTNFFINQPDCTYSSGIGIAQNTSATILKYGVSSTEPLLVPSIKLNSNESVNGTSFNLYRTNNTQLSQTSDGSIKNLKNNSFQDIQRAVSTEYSEEVNSTKYHSLSF